MFPEIKQHSVRVPKEVMLQPFTYQNFLPRPYKCEVLGRPWVLSELTPIYLPEEKTTILSFLKILMVINLKKKWGIYIVSLYNGSMHYLPSQIQTLSYSYVVHVSISHNRFTNISNIIPYSARVLAYINMYA